MMSCSASSVNQPRLSSLAIDSIAQYYPKNCKPVGAGVVYSSNPNYPPTALLMGLVARVETSITLDTNGKIYAVSILKTGGPEFDDSVRAAIYRSRFSPAQINCKPVPCKFIKTYNFAIKAR